MKPVERRKSMAKKTNSKDEVSPKNGGSDRAQGFAIRAPEAVSVQLVGDFTHWQEKPISLKKEAGGLWRAIVPLSPGEHHYRFLVDGEWRDDPECAIRVPNPFGGHNMMRKVA
ncbi:MAG TPA: glycogen-binding domain-containing protein [Verrucomicrobiae bacterium]|nr:glycogen-binding domain-containing protein [Verrucomicrobiae bacterium]